MPFSRAFKARLVAMVLIILTAVPRLDAAPMYPLSTGAPDWYRAAEEATNLGAKPPLGIDLNFPPPEEDGDPLDLARGYAGPRNPNPYAQSTGAQPWSMPHGVGPSYSTSAANEGHHPLAPGGSRVAMPPGSSKRYAAELRDRLAGPPLSDAEIYQILVGDKWKALSREHKSEFLNVFGTKVFTLQKFQGLPSIGRKKLSFGTALHQKLVKEYLKVRLDFIAEQKHKGPLEFGWSRKVPNAEALPVYARRSFRYGEAGWQRITQSATQAVDSEDPFDPFCLGEFDVKAVGEGSSNSGKKVWKNVLAGQVKNVNLVAVADQGDQTMYIGKLKIKLASTRDDAESV